MITRYRSRKMFVGMTVLLAALWCAGEGFAFTGLSKENPLNYFQFFDKTPAANDLAMSAIDGRIFKLSQLRGKVVLLNFWRQNCQYCGLEKKQLRSMVAHLKRPDLLVLSVNLWDDPNWVRSATAKEPADILYATRMGDRQQIIENKVGGRLLGYFVVNEAKEAIYEVKGFPSTYVVDKQGRVVAQHLGMAEWTNPRVQEWLTKLLGTGPAAKSSETDPGSEGPAWLDSLLGSTSTAGPASVASTSAGNLSGLHR
jgi:peroxiredoxin